MLGFALLTASQQQQQSVRLTAITVAGILLVLVGACGFINSYLILASLIVWGWLIVGGIGLFTFVTGIALMTGADWSWSAGSTLSILNLFMGFIEIIGAFNYRFVVLGWVGLGQGIGVATIVLSGISLFLLNQKEVTSYFSKYEYYDVYGDR